MIYDLNAYRHVVKPQVKDWLEARPDESQAEAIAKLGLFTSCPLVCICYFVEELQGKSESLTSLIDRLTKFYHVDSIIGKE